MLTLLVVDFLSLEWLAKEEASNYLVRLAHSATLYFAHQYEVSVAMVISSAGEPELEPGALEPSIFSGAGAGAGAYLNISCGAGVGATKYLSAPVLSIANFNNFLSP